MTILETDRLIIRDLQESDLPALIAMNQDPEVMQYFPKPYSQAESLLLYQGIKMKLRLMDTVFGLLKKRTVRSLSAW